MKNYLKLNEIAKRKYNMTKIEEQNILNFILTKHCDINLEKTIIRHNNIINQKQIKTKCNIS